MKKSITKLMLLAAVFLLPSGVRAQSTAATLPYSTGFETTDDNSAWQIINGSQTNKWFVGTAAFNGGSQGLYISDNASGTTNNYSGSATTVFAVRTINFSTAGQYAITFDWRCAGESTFDYLRCFLVPASTSFTAGTLPTSVTATGTPSGWIDLGGKMNVTGSAWNNTMEIVDITTAGDMKLVFLWHNDGSVYNQMPAAVDNVQVGELSCPVPTNVTYFVDGTITWSPGGTESEWEWRLGSGEWTSVSDTSVVLTDLAVNTQYAFSVRAICGAGDTSFTVSTSFRTPCDALTQLPYVQNFDNEETGSSTSSVFPPCMMRLNNGTSNFGYPYVGGSTYNHTPGGAKGLYWYNTTTVGTYGDYQYVVLPGVDTDVFPVNTLQLNFWAKPSSTSYSPVFEVGVMTNPNDITTFQLMATVNVMNVTDWQEFEIPLASYTGTGSFVAIRALRPTSSWYAYVDDIVLDLLPSCPRPTDLTVDSVTTDEAYLSWVDNTSENYQEYVVEYRANGTTGPWLTATANDTTVVLTNLDINTVYELKLYAVCGMDDTSNVVTGTFRTLAGLPISEFPYSCGFEIDSVNGINEAADWVLENGNQTNYWVIGNATGNGGSRSLYITNGGSAYSYTISSLTYVFAYATFSLSEGSYAFSYDWKAYGESSYDFIRAAMVPASVDISAGSYCGFDNASAMPAGSIALDGAYRLNLQSSWQTQSGEFVISTPGIYNMVFMWRNDASGGTQPPAAIDNVQLALNTCPKPQGLASTSVSNEEITITWQPGGEETSWLVTIDGQSEEVYDTTYTFMQLSANTLYNIQVRAICSSDDTSMASAINVRTTCGALTTMPYVQDFEDAATGSSTSATFVNCMTRVNNGTQYFGYPYVSSSSTYNHTPGGAKGLYWYNTTTTGTYGDYQYVVLPPVDSTLFPINTLQLSFWARPSLTSYSPQFQVGVMTNPNDPNSFTQVATINVLANTTWQEFTTLFGSYTGAGNCVAIRALRPTSSWYAYVDDITLEPIPSCAPVVSHNVQTTAAAARITWVSDPDFPTPPDSYEVSYGFAADSLVNATVISTTDLAVVLTGLTPDTSYVVSISPVCDGNTDLGHTFQFSTSALPCAEWDTTGVGGNSSPEASYVVGTPGTSTTNVMPVNGGYNYSYCNHLIKRSDIPTVPSGTTYFSGIDFQFAGSQPMTSKTNCTIYMCHTTMTTCDAFANPADLVLVYEGPLNCTTTGWNHFEFNRGTFAYNGTSNIIVAIVDNSGAHNSSDNFYYESLSGSHSHRVYRDDAPYTFADLGTVTAGTSVWRSNMHLTTGGNGGGTCIMQANCAAPAVSVEEDTNGNFLLSWIPGYQETSWDVDYSPVGSNTWTTVATGITQMSYAIPMSSLLPNTEYTFRVAANCTDSNIAGTVNFITPCAPYPVPFNESFDTWSSTVADPLPNCWLKHTNYSSNYPYASTSQHHSGTKAMYMYSTASTYCYMVLPQFALPIDSTVVSFWLYAGSTSYALQVGVMTDPDDVTTFQQVAQVVPTVTGTWEAFEISFATYQDSGSYIAIMSPNGIASYPYLDDLSVTRLTSCPRVATVSTTGVTMTDATVRWSLTSATDYEVQYGPSGFALGSGTTVQVSNADSVNITGLAPNTAYDVYVRGICTADTGAWSFNHNFRTLCGSITSLPWNEDFNNLNITSSTMIPCWDYMGGGYVATTSSYSVSGNGLGFYPSSSSTNDHILVLPPFDTITSALEMSLMIRPESTGGNSGTFSIGYVTDVNDATSFVETLLLQSTQMTTSFTQYDVVFPGAPAGSRIAMRHNVNSTSWYWFIDDVNVHQAPACLRPAGVTVSGITETNATVNIDDPTMVGQYVVILTSGSTVVDSTVVTGTTHTYTNLTGSTAYGVRVYSICSDGSTTSAVTANFHTDICNGAVVVATGDPSTATGTTYYAPVNNFYNYTLSETIIDSAELGGAMNITALAYYYDYSSPSTAKTSVTIWIQPTTKSTFASTSDIEPLNTATAVQVYSGPLNCTEGWNYFGLTTDYAYNGTGNLMVIVDDNSGDYDGSSYVFASQSTTGYKTLAYYSDSYDPDINTISSSYSGTKAYYQYRPVMQLISCGASVACDDPIILSDTTTETTATFTWGSTGASNYEVAIVEGTWVAPASGTMESGTSHTFTGLTGETVYTLGVRSVCSANVRSEWATVQVITASHPCDIPTNVIARDITFSGATIGWTNGADETEWDIHVTGTNYDETVTVQTNPYTLTGLNAAQEYTVTVRARCDETNFSEWSAPATFSTQTCQPVNGVSVGNLTANSATVSWTAPAGVSNFEVEYGTSGFARGNGTTVTVSGTSYTITGLTADMAYDVYVRSVCAEGVTSAWSDAVEFTTLETQGIDDVANAAISLYPNPASTTVTISGISGEATVTVVDMNGRVVITTQALSSSVTLTLTDLAQGAYFVRITGEQVNAIRKLIVK